MKKLWFLELPGWKRVPIDDLGGLNLLPILDFKTLATNELTHFSGYSLTFLFMKWISSNNFLLIPFLTKIWPHIYFWVYHFKDIYVYRYIFIEYNLFKPYTFQFGYNVFSFQSQTLHELFFFVSFKILCVSKSALIDSSVPSLKRFIGWSQKHFKTFEYSRFCHPLILVKIHDERKAIDSITADGLKHHINYFEIWGQMLHSCYKTLHFE